MCECSPALLQQLLERELTSLDAVDRLLDIAAFLELWPPASSYWITPLYAQ